MNAEEHGPNERAQSGISSISKVLRVLSCFSYKEPELSASEIGRRIGLPSPTLYRYLQTLEDDHFLQRDPVTHLYSLGFYLVELSGIALSSLEVRRLSQSNMTELCNALGMNVNLSIIYEGDTFHLNYAVCTPVAHYYTVLGRRTPANLTAMGKIIMAHWPFEDVAAMIEKYGWRPRTSQSVTDLETFHEELMKARRDGYATDICGVKNDTCCLAACIYSRTGKPEAAISVSTTRERFAKEFNRIRDQVLMHADRISTNLGYIDSSFLPSDNDNKIKNHKKKST